MTDQTPSEVELRDLRVLADWLNEEGPPPQPDRLETFEKYDGSLVSTNSGMNVTLENMHLQYLLTDEGWSLLISNDPALRRKD